MNLKRIIRTLLFASCIALVSPVMASNANPTTTETSKEVLKNRIETRLTEIKNIDKSNLTSSEKKELRKEVKSLKKQARNGGIYISIGGAILIVLLLILLL